MSEKIKPLYANAFFRMSISGLVTQFMVYYYEDPELYYHNLSLENRRKELINIRKNLQYYLDEEKIYVNDKRVKARVRRIDLDFIKENLPFIEFIITFRGDIKKGRNVYLDEYEQEVTEYPYEFTWYLPGRIIEYNIDGEVKVSGGMLNAKVKKGAKIKGKEKIVFVLN